jgi:r-opsin
MFGGKLCTLHAFTGALFGYVQIVTLVFISYDRFRVIVYGYSAKPLSYSKACLILGFIWVLTNLSINSSNIFFSKVYSFGWAVTPLFGFGRYTLDGILTECSFDYLSRDPLNVYFIWSVCFFGYAFPLAVILLAYFFIAKVSPKISMSYYNLVFPLTGRICS